MKSHFEPLLHFFTKGQMRQRIQSTITKIHDKSVIAKDNSESASPPLVCDKDW
jgi:hypothetical protein